MVLEIPNDFLFEFLVVLHLVQQLLLVVVVLYIHLLYLLPQLLLTLC
jgi:hypothetical protein